MSEYINDFIEMEDTQKNKFLTFSVENEEFAMEINYVTEIIKLQDITQVPDVASYVKGVINLRGKIIPVIDMRLRFSIQEKEYHDRTCVIVIDVDDVTVGCVVDSVSEVAIIPENDIVPPPDFNRHTNKYIKAMGKTNTGVKLILDCSELVKNNF